MGRRNGIGAGYPGMERNDPRLGAEADHGKKKDNRFQTSGNAGHPGLHSFEIHPARRPVENEKEHDDEGRADMGHDGVKNSAARRLRGPFERHQKIGGDRHGFPRDQEREKVRGKHHGIEAQDQDVKEQAGRTGVGQIAGNPCGIERHCYRDNRYHDHEKSRQGVSTQRKPDYRRHGKRLIGHRSDKGEY